MSKDELIQELFLELRATLVGVMLEGCSADKSIRERLMHPGEVLGCIGLKRCYGQVLQFGDYPAVYQSLSHIHAYSLGFWPVDFASMRLCPGYEDRNDQS